MIPRSAARLVSVTLTVAAMACAAAEEVRLDFNRDIRPILADSCFPCHGQDAHRRRAGLRLDTPEGLRTDLGGGRAVVIPGKPEASELVKRVFSEDPDEVMPPPDSHRTLSDEQRDRLREWIRHGGEYAPHRAFLRPQRGGLPAVKRREWVRQPMDAFVLAHLEAKGWEPSRDAEPAVWLRRAALDLTGLAPAPDEVDAFEAAVQEQGEAAYAEAVDRWLLSPRFGERQAQEWLDVARFADTHGFNNDTTRTLWRWRDWVIRSFNEGMSYDRFIVEQLAGDLLPEPTLEQRVATGFGRNHVVNSEGGIIGEEYRVEYVADRVRTLGMAWLGLTLECARCHAHKFDPISQQDYYRLFAFFNGIDEFGEDGRIGNAAPILVAPTYEEQSRLRHLDAELARATLALEQWQTPEQVDVLAVLEAMAREDADAATNAPAFALGGDALSREHTRSHAALGAVLDLDGTKDVPVELSPAAFSGAEAWTLSTWVRWAGDEAPVMSSMDMLMDPSAGGAGRGAEVRITGRGHVEVRVAEFWPSYAIQVRSEQDLRSNEWHHIAVAYDGSTKASGVRLYLDGRPAPVVVRRDGLTGRTTSRHQPRLGGTIAAQPERFRGSLAGLIVETNRLDAVRLARDVERQWAALLVAEPAERAATENRARWLWMRRVAPGYAVLWERRERWMNERLSLLRGAPQTMVMAEAETSRPTHVLNRGRYDAPGERVDPGVPAILSSFWPDDAPTNRLGLARWLIHPDHPLTARVVVNRVWAQLFGTGLVKTVEDFGVQGEPPSHPELLDWLARDFVEGGWDVRGLFRSLVLSRTYRQDSAMTAESVARDPENRMLARGPRVRLAAEVLRDQALAAAGLLEERLGGPSVFPPQPSALYEGVVVAADYPGTKWIPSDGADRYRRSLYTFWKRTVPHPVMTTLDAPDREFCTARRLLTNTPLQALALMNEPAFVEAGRRLGLSAMSDTTSASDRIRMSQLFRRATGRRPGPAEIDALLTTWVRLRDGFSGDTGAVRDYLGAEGSPEEAAWAAAGSLVLNLDEAITKN